MVWQYIIPAAASIIGGLLSQKGNKDAGEANAQMQREFAQQGVRWKVADAKAAGIHPLYALGASTPTASAAYVGDTSMGNAIANAGQDLSRAWSATRTQPERGDVTGQVFGQYNALLGRQIERDWTREMHNMRMEEFDARQELLRNQVMRATSPAQVGPGMPSSVDLAVGQDSRVNVKKAEQVARSRSNSSETANVPPFWTRVETAPGIYREVPNPELNLDAEWAHNAIAMQGYVDRLYSKVIGGPHYFQYPRKRFDPSPGSYQMDRGYQRYGVERRGR